MMKNMPIKGLIMWFCAALFYGFQFIIRVSPSVMANDLMHTLAVDAAVLGVIVSFYYYGYSGMQIPTGILIDRIGVRRPLTVACLLCSLGAVIFAYSTSIPLLATGRLLMGIGSAFGLLSCIKISSLWLHPRLLTFFVGMALIIGTLGAVGGVYPLALLIDKYDLKTANLILASLSALLAVSAWTVVRDNQHSQEITSNKEPLLFTLRDILRNPQTWLFGFYGMLMYTPLSGFADLWGVSFISKLYVLDRTTAGQAISFFYVGVGLGAPVWSGVLNYLESYKNTMLISSVGTLAFFVILLYFPPNSFDLVKWLYFLGGFISSGQFVAFGGVADINLRTRTATASGTHNMLCMLSGVILQPLIGALLDFSAGTANKAANIAHDYSLHDFQIALLIVPLCLLGAVFMVFFIKEAYVKHAPEKKEELLKA
jgi:sugar phosphate permease